MLTNGSLQVEGGCSALQHHGKMSLARLVLNKSALSGLRVSLWCVARCVLPRADLTLPTIAPTQLQRALDPGAV